MLLTECENMEIDLDNLMYSNVEILVHKGNGFEENPIIQHAFIEFLKATLCSPAHHVHVWVRKKSMGIIKIDQLWLNSALSNYILQCIEQFAAVLKYMTMK